MFKPIKWLLAAGIAANLSAVGVGTGIGAGAAFAQEITGAGATFPAPIYAKWAEAYQKATGVKMNYQSIGSSGGIRQINAKNVDFGASDAPLTQEQLDKDGLMQFPAVIGGVVPVVNITDVKPGDMRLTGQVLGDIYMGKITKWNDKAIAELNPKLKLPAQDIALVRRADGSAMWVEVTARAEPSAVPGTLRVEAVMRDVTERKKLEDQARDLYHQLLQAEKLASLGAEAVAVCLLFSFMRPAHEQAVRDRLREAHPEWWISASSDLLPQIREYFRLSTTVINAYVSPVLGRYVTQLGRILDEQLALMREDAYLVNTARAALIDHDALGRALEGRRSMD